MLVDLDCVPAFMDSRMKGILVFFVFLGSSLQIAQHKELFVLLILFTLIEVFQLLHH